MIWRSVWKKVQGSPVALFLYQLHEYLTPSVVICGWNIDGQVSMDIITWKERHARITHTWRRSNSLPEVWKRNFSPNYPYLIRGLDTCSLACSLACSHWVDRTIPNDVLFFRLQEAEDMHLLCRARIVFPWAVNSRQQYCCRDSQCQHSAAKGKL